MKALEENYMPIILTLDPQNIPLLFVEWIIGNRNFAHEFPLLLAAMKAKLNNKMVVTSSRQFLPPHLFGNRDQCRNNRRWPFRVADPICVVEHSASGRLIFDLCSVPLCARKLLPLVLRERTPLGYVFKRCVSHTCMSYIYNASKTKFS